MGKRHKRDVEEVIGQWANKHGTANRGQRTGENGQDWRQGVRDRGQGIRDSCRAKIWAKIELVTGNKTQLQGLGTMHCRCQVQGRHEQLGLRSEDWVQGRFRVYYYIITASSRTFFTNSTACSRSDINLESWGK